MPSITPETIEMYERMGQQFIEWVQMYYLAIGIVVIIGLLLAGVSRFNNNRNRHS